MKRIFISTLFLLVFLSACKDDEPTIEFSCENDLTIEGFSFKDLTGVLVGTSDADDWGFDDEWELWVIDLFIQKLPVCAPQEDNEMAVFPNPAYQNFYMTIPEITGYEKFDFVAINRSCEIVLDQNNLDVGAYTIQYEATGEVDDTLRIYYKVKSEDCELRGHGDFIVKK